MSVCDKKLFKLAVFSDALNRINVNFCMVVVVTELYPFTLLSATLIVFQGHSTVKRFSLKIVCSYPIKLKLCRLFSKPSR